MQTRLENLLLLIYVNTFNVFQQSINSNVIKVTKFVVLWQRVQCHKSSSKWITILVFHIKKQGLKTSETLIIAKIQLIKLRTLVVIKQIKHNV